MSLELNKRIAAFKDVKKDGYDCSNPIIDIRTLTGIDIACIKDNQVTLYTTEGDISCLEAWIRCSDCLDCPPARVVRCYCDGNTPCPPCHTCNPLTGICEPNCEGKPCVGGQCVDCDELNPCQNGEVCNQGTCMCPPGWVRDAYGVCRRCTEASHCSGCEVCYAYECTAKTCAVGNLHPITCECVTCYDNTHCTEENTCCNPLTGNCDCCPGYYKDPVTNKCIRYPKCVAGQCGPCMQCVGEECVPTSCPPGRAHVGDECCAIITDCETPSCPAGYGVKRVGNVCVCVNCDQPCADGVCPEGCQCNGLRRCEPKPPSACDGYCDENTPCKYGCGCNLALKRCEDCSKASCGATNTCSQLVGCNCSQPAVGVSGAVTCVPDDCNKDCKTPGDCGPNCGCGKDERCIACDRPCDNNGDCEWGCYCDKGTKRCKKNPCPTTCVNGRDCGPLCGCVGAMGCYPCNSFDETECGSVDGCNWNGTNCEEKKKVGCSDTLTILKDDDNCQIKGRLTTHDCCECPEIGMYFYAEFDVNGNVAVTRKLLKGLSLNSPDLDMTGITSDYPAQSGKTEISVYANTLTGNKVFIGKLNDDWSSGANQRLDYVSNGGCTVAGIGILNIVLEIKTTLEFQFYSGCKYTINADHKVNGSCGTSPEFATVYEVFKINSCRKPLFTWSKGDTVNSMSVFRKVYANKSGNYYEDTIGAAQGLELNKYYKLETDCGCVLPSIYTCDTNKGATKLVLCQPKELLASATQSSCLKDVTIEEHSVCGLFEGFQYRLYVNGVLYGIYVATGSVLFPGGLTFTYSEPVTLIELVSDLENECKNCNLSKNFVLNSPCGCSVAPLQLTMVTAPTCESGFEYEIQGGTGPYAVKVVRTIPPVDHEADSLVYTGTVPNTFTFRGPLETGTYYVRVTDALGCTKLLSFPINCADLGNPSVNYNCDTQKLIITRTGTYALEYKIGGGSWTLLPTNNTISGAITNGIYPGYITLRRVDDHSATITLDLTVNCDTCTLKITSAALTDSCSKVAIVASGTWTEYKIDNGAWTAGTSPITLGSPLTSGGSVLISIRDDDNPSCFKSITLNCTDCGSYDIGTPNFDHDGATGDITIENIDATPSPLLPATCSVQIEWWRSINGVLVRQPDVLFPSASWAATITLATGVTTTDSDTRYKADIYLLCPNNVKCLIATLDEHIIVADDLGTLTYNCVDPDQGIQWSGGSTDVQALITGVWTDIIAGTTLANGSYQVRTITDGAYSTVTKTLTVNCSGGGDVGDPCQDFANYFTITDACEGTVTVGLSISAPYSAYISLKVNEGYGSCGSTPVIWNSPSQMITPGGTVVITGVPVANRMRSLSYNLIGSGDACTSCFQVGNCSNGGACPSTLFDVGDLVCSTLDAAPSNRSLRFNNQNNFSVLAYVDNLYAATVPANAANYNLGFYPAGSTHSVKLVCVSDPTVFTISHSITLNC